MIAFRTEHKIPRGKASLSLRSTAGFALIEGMIAIAVLGIGLLALVALQANLVREAADAKARSRIAALVSSWIDQARASGYESLAPHAAVGCASGNAVCQAQTDAAVSDLKVAQQVAETEGANGSRFKTMTVTASWKDSSGEPRTLVVSTIISPLSLDTSATLVNQQLADDVAKLPVVRTDNPATAGVVPIALGNGSSSAASNPTPELIGQKNNQSIVGTRFNVLTYMPEGAAVRMQRRIETAVVKCKCRYGAGGSNLPEIYRAAQWPAIWTGERYEVYRPSTNAAAPGEAYRSAPEDGVQQSDLCLECCRDHHDTTASGVAKFDPERTGNRVKYNLVGGRLVEVTDTTGGAYINACRLIRVDGLWRTAADLYARQFGLLETQSVNGVQAKSGLPTSAATTAYTSFVKNYLKQYDGSTGSAPANAQSLFDATAGLNEPSLIRISAPSNSDYRYLHARALYVDYLEEAARKKIAEVLADTGPNGRCPQGRSIEDCVMPYLPFTSANLTEIASWLASASDVLVVNSGNLLATNPNEPSGGRSYGKKAGTSDNVARVRGSNSGIAVFTATGGFAGVDPNDDVELSDKQAFEVGGTPNTPVGDDFFVAISGGGANPYVFYTLGSDSGECVKLANGTRPCDTNSTLPMAGSIRLSNYWVETTTRRSVTHTCTNHNGTPTSVTATQDVPTFRNYAVTAATIGASSGSIASPTNDGKKTESTVVSFTSIPANATVNVTLSEQDGSPTYATVTSCTTNASGNQMNDIVWSKPWEQ